MSKTFFDYGPFTDALTDGDVLLGVDVSDTTQSAQGSTKRATVAQVKAAAPVQSVNAQTGAVALTASSVGALASGDDVSELNNDAGYVASSDVSDIVKLTQAEYDALSPPVATTLYIVVG
jgi:hypothetical protein